jgi:hypothetical protein
LSFRVTKFREKKIQKKEEKRPDSFLTCSTVAKNKEGLLVFIYKFVFPIFLLPNLAKSSYG